MRDQAEVEQRLRGLLCEELDRRLAQSTRRLPTKCSHNHRQPLDHRKNVNGEPNPNYNRISDSGGGKRHLDVLAVEKTMGLCMLNAETPDDWNGTICEDPIDAQRCPYFDPKDSPGDVYAKYEEDLQSLNLTGEVEALLWVLDGPGGTPKGPALPWWKKIWFRYILKVDYEPLSTPRDVAVALLPPRNEALGQLPASNQDASSGETPHS